jgi:hypothetical protein
MKTKLLITVLLFGSVAPAALAASGGGETNVQAKGSQILVTPGENPAVTTTQDPSAAEPGPPAAEPNQPKDASPDYAAAMLAVTQRFSATLAAIAQAVKEGQMSSDQAVEMSAEQYQLSQMQFELLSLWREIEDQDPTKTPDPSSKPELSDEDDIVLVASPFSSLQLDASLTDFLGLTPSQVQAIKQLMTVERPSLESLLTELRTTREKLLAAGSGHINEKQLKGLADAEANLLAKLIVANARMQSKIYKILTPEQRKKLANFERTQGSVTLDTR